MAASRMGWSSDTHAETRLQAMVSRVLRRSGSQKARSGARDLVGIESNAVESMAMRAPFSCTKMLHRWQTEDNKYICIATDDSLDLSGPARVQVRVWASRKLEKTRDANDSSAALSPTSIMDEKIAPDDTDADADADRLRWCWIVPVARGRPWF